MDVYIIGSPFTGKSTLLYRLTGGKGVGSLKLNDKRLKTLVDFFKPKKITPPFINLYDSDALGKMFSYGKERSLFQQLVNADAFIEVVGGLTENFTTFTDTTLKFLSIESEVLEGNIQRLKKEVAVGKGDEKVLGVLEKAYKIISEGIPLNSGDFSDEERKILKGYGFLSLKPRLVVLNITENSKIEDSVYEELKSQNLPYLLFNVLKDDVDDITEKLFQKLLEILQLIVFFTPSEKEVRGWLLEKGSTAVDAAGKIHKDLARTFIKAEVINWEELIKYGGWKGAREKNFIRLEGRDYVVKDGDCIYIRASAIKS
ncbi:MAG: DUF933 domain-containing protein [candidate division WOR-3 bacterium]